MLILSWNYEYLQYFCMAKISKKKIESRRRRVGIITRELRKMFPEAKVALNYSDPWELLVAVILSAQCTDKKVNEVTEKLFEKYRTVEDYVKAEQAEFETDIYQTGFYRSKAKSILASARIVKEKHGGKVPGTMEELLGLPGVARKTANIVLGSAYGISEGIAVDTHVKRLSGILGLSGEKDPNKIEKDLMQIVPKRDWIDFNYLLVNYGRKYCIAKKHDHENCPLTKILKKI